MWMATCPPTDPHVPWTPSASRPSGRATTQASSILAPQTTTTIPSLLSLAHPKTSSPFHFLAHLWGAYAIPVALSVVRRESSVVRRVSSISTITTRNN